MATGGSTAVSHGKPSAQKYWAQNGICVLTYVGDLSTIKDADAVVTGEDSKLKGKSFITQTLLNISPMDFGQKRHDMEQKFAKKGPKLWSAHTTHLEPPSPFKHVFHAVMGSDKSHGIVRKMKKMYKLTLKKAKKYQVKVLVMPVLGTGRAGLGVCEAVQAIVESIADRQDKGSLETIYLLTLDKEIAEKLATQCKITFTSAYRPQHRFSFRASFKRKKRPLVKRNSTYHEPVRSKDDMDLPKDRPHNNDFHSLPSIRNKKPVRDIESWEGREKHGRFERGTNAQVIDDRIDVDSEHPTRNGHPRSKYDNGSRLSRSMSEPRRSNRERFGDDRHRQENDRGPTSYHDKHDDRHRQENDRSPTRYYGDRQENGRSPTRYYGDRQENGRSPTRYCGDRQENERGSTRYHERHDDREYRSHGDRSTEMEQYYSTSNKDIQEAATIYIRKINGSHEHTTDHGIQPIHSSVDHGSKSVKHEQTVTACIETGKSVSQAHHNNPSTIEFADKHRAQMSYGMNNHKTPHESTKQTQRLTNGRGDNQDKREDNPERHEPTTKEIPPEMNQLNQSVSTSCPICIEPITDPKKLDKCGHVFCRKCIEQSFEKCKPVCPSCGMVYGMVMGNMPEGSMDVGFSGEHLPGYENHGTITINYHFQNGIQQDNHPNPGYPYRGTRRTAYLPDCGEGRVVLKLLKAAFDRRLTFTIGRSTTTGHDNVVTWNDIHHKTQQHGGPQSYGYPDHAYLDRVKEELASKGVTEESIKVETTL